jgi:hypothetical protein
LLSIDNKLYVQITLISEVVSHKRIICGTMHDVDREFSGR